VDPEGGAAATGDAPVKILGIAAFSFSVSSSVGGARISRTFLFVESHLSDLVL